MLIMLSVTYSSYIVLCIGTAFILRFLSPPSDNGHDDLWDRINKVGVPKGVFPWTRAVLGSTYALLRNAHEGYQKFSKHDLPFALPTVWTGKAVVVVPKSALHLTNRSENELIGFPALVENIQLSYFIPDRDVIQNAIHFEVARKDLTKRNLDRQLAPTAEEIESCFRSLWGDKTEWTVVNGWDMCGQIITRVALRTLLGFPACRNEELVNVTKQFANHLFTAAALINCTPPALRPIVAPILALPTKLYRAHYRKIVLPLIHDRIRKREQYEKPGQGELPSDFLQWLIARATQHGPEHLDASKLSYRLLALNTMFVYAMGFIFSQTVIDFMHGMASECWAAVNQHPEEGLASGEALDQLHRIDSAIRESMRLSDVAVVNMPRDVVGNKSLDLGNGIVCPPGTRLSYPTQSIHTDPDFWDDPLRFNAFRFSDPEKSGRTPLNEQQQGPRKERERLVDLTTTFLAWGYGKKACPGRWYAGQTMKQCLAYMVMHYEVELVGRPPQRKALLNAMVPPTDVKLRFRRKS
ncbi:cytochrome P450 [Xylariaceae sp. FL0594]|nr:cytochrome P450 [Xylariaceae sp. FL0594]